MSMEPGIDVEDLASIERDQFVYFMEMEHQLNDPSDWPKFRDELVGALATAFGWEPSEADVRACGQALDRVQQKWDPATRWDGFLTAVWEVRSTLRDLTSGSHRVARTDPEAVD